MALITDHELNIVIFSYKLPDGFLQLRPDTIWRIPMPEKAAYHTVQLLPLVV